MLIVYIIFEFKDEDFYSKKKLAMIAAQEQNSEVSEAPKDGE